MNRIFSTLFGRTGRDRPRGKRPAPEKEVGPAEDRAEGETVRFPVQRTSLSTYRCPCGGNGIVLDWVESSGLDDADPAWGGYTEEYSFAEDDPCARAYTIVGMDPARREWILKKKGSPLP